MTLLCRYLPDQLERDVTQVRLQAEHVKRVESTKKMIDLAPPDSVGLVRLCGWIMPETGREVLAWTVCLVSAAHGGPCQENS
jgi:hypothetical protein